MCDLIKKRYQYFLQLVKMCLPYARGVESKDVECIALFIPLRFQPHLLMGHAAFLKISELR